MAGLHAIIQCKLDIHDQDKNNVKYAKSAEIKFIPLKTPQ